jgi:hypothetical protein
MSETTTEDQKAKLRAFIMPIIFVILITVLLSVFTLNFYEVIEEQPSDISPFPENPEDPGGIAQGALLTTVFYVTLAFIGGLVVLIVIKKGFMQLLVYFFALMMGISWFVFGLFYGTVILFTIVIDVLNYFWELFPTVLQNAIDQLFNWSFSIESQEIFLIEVLLYIFAILLGLLGTLSFGIQNFEKIWLRNVMMIFFGAMIGSLLAIHLGLLTACLILIGLSIYDIYAVFRGPLKGIIDHGRQSAEEYEKMISSQDEGEVMYEKVPLLPALPVYSTPLINIGLGDFAFFSMLSSTALVISYELITPIPLIATLIGLFTGVYYTFRLLEKEKALPGLPLPIFGGLGCLILSIIGGLILNIFTLDSIIALFA